MATVPTFDTFAAGEVVTAAKLNKNIKDAGAFLTTPPHCVMKATADAAIPNNAVTTVSSMTSVLLDTDTMADTVNGRIYIRTPGVYVVTLYGAFASNTTGYRGFLMYKNNTEILCSDYRSPVNGTATIVTLSSQPVRFAEGDFINPRVIQNSGVALNFAVSNSAGVMSVRWYSA